MVSLKCIQTNPLDRSSMSKVVEMLEVLNCHQCLACSLLLERTKILSRHYQEVVRSNDTSLIFSNCNKAHYCYINEKVSLIRVLYNELALCIEVRIIYLRKRL